MATIVAVAACGCSVVEMQCETPSHILRTCVDEPQWPCILLKLMLANAFIILLITSVIIINITLILTLQLKIPMLCMYVPTVVEVMTTVKINTVCISERA